MRSFKRSFAGLMAGVVALGVTVLVPEPASAAWSDCPVPYNCWFTESSGGGTRKQYAGNNPNISVFTRSGYNRNGLLSCGYSEPNYTGSVFYSRPPGQMMNYSLREINSNLFRSIPC